jgi:hypothetical protein
MLLSYTAFQFRNFQHVVQNCRKTSGLIAWQQAFGGEHLEGCGAAIADAHESRGTVLTDLNWRKYLIPKEHGAWAMWIVPWIIAVFASGGLKSAAVQVFLATLLVFFTRAALASGIRLHSREPLTARKCMAVGASEFMAAMLCVLPIVLSGNLAFILISILAGGILVADLVWVRHRMERNLLIELIGVAGFVLSAPLVYVANMQGWHMTAFWLWLLSYVYFAGSVFYVKLRLVSSAVAGKARRKVKKYARLIIAYTVLVSLLLLVSATIMGMTGWFLLSYVPWFVYLLINGFKPVRNLNRVGWVLVAHSLYFTTILSIFFLLNMG